LTYRHNSLAKRRYGYVRGRIQPAEDRPQSCTISGFSDSSSAQVCLCLPANEMHEVWLSRPDSSLQGLDVLDLIMMQHHILGNPMPDFPQMRDWQLYAADIQGNGHLSALDIVQLRDLMLGRKKSGADFPTWRFLPQNRALALLGQSNPLGALMDIHDPGSGDQYLRSAQKARFRAPDSTFTRPLSFTGFRMGDVSGPRPVRAHLSLGLHQGAGAPGDTLELPLLALQPLQLSGWQGTLRFDTNQVELLDIYWANTRAEGSTTQREWHLSAPGECRFVWQNALRPQSWRRGEPLLWIQVRLRRAVPRPQPLLQRAEGPLPALALKDNAEMADLWISDTDLAPVPARAEAPVHPPRPLEFRVYPNPAGQHFRIEADAPEAREARLSSVDATGALWLDRPWSLKKGLNVLPARQLPAIGPGRYVFQLTTEEAVYTIDFIKQ
jgi:hypothetical protein